MVIRMMVGVVIRMVVGVVIRVMIRMMVGAVIGKLTRVVVALASRAVPARYVMSRCQIVAHGDASCGRRTHTWAPSSWSSSPTSYNVHLVFLDSRPGPDRRNEKDTE